MDKTITRKSLLGMAAGLALALGLVLCPALSVGAIAQEAAPSGDQESAQETFEFTDSAGRTVELPRNITMVAPSGPLAQQVLLTFDPQVLCGLATEPSDIVEKYFGIDGDDYVIFGQIYGGKGNLNKEAVAASGAQVVIDIGEAKKSIVEDLDALQEALGIPCIHIAASIGTYDQAYTMLGEVLGQPERAEQLAAYCAKVRDSVAKAVEGLDEADMVRVAYVTDETHAIAKGSFQGQVIDAYADNVVVVEDVVGSGTGNEVSLEQIALWDPDVIFFSNRELYESVADDPVWSTLTAVAEGAYYYVPQDPYCWMGMPPSVNQVLGMQWFPRVLYPQLFDGDLADAVSDYFKTIYGYELSEDEMAELVADSAPDQALEADAA